MKGDKVKWIYSVGLSERAGQAGAAVLARHYSGRVLWVAVSCLSCEADFFGEFQAKMAYLYREPWWLSRRMNAVLP